MAKSSNRFGLDEVNTQLTAPTSNVQVQGPLNTSLTTSTRSKGITDFSNALGGLARKKLANKIHNDTVDAQLAFAYGKEQPKGLEPEAEFAFNKSKDLELSKIAQDNLNNYAVVEGNAILNDSTLTRKEKLSRYQLGMQDIINTAKQGITPTNASSIFPSFDREYSRISLIAATELAKQKKEEESSANGAAVIALVDEIYKETAGPLIYAHSGKNTIVEDDDLSPKDFAKLTVDANNYVASKGLSLKNFNEIVKHITATGRGADNREIKATALTAMVGRLLQAAEEGDFTVDPKIITNLINQIKGNPQSPTSTLRTEISTQTPYGKIFKTIEDGYISNLKTLLTSKRTLKNQATTDADNQIGNELFDNPENYTLETGLALLKGMSNFKSQNTAEKRWRAMHTDAALNGSTSAAYVTALTGAHKEVFTPNGKRIDEIAFSAYVYEHKLKPEAATKLRAAIDPESKAAKHRTAVLENKTVVKLLSSFKSTTKEYLKNLNIEEITRIANGLEFGQPLPDKLILAKLRQKLGGSSPIFNKAAKILNAELDFTEQLETLILNNPDKEPIELAREAKQLFDDLFADVVKDQPLGTTATDRDVAVLDTHLEKRKKLEAASGTAPEPDVVSVTAPEKEVTEKKQTALTIALKESDNVEHTTKYLELATKEVELAQKAIVDEAQFKVKTRAEKLSIIMEKGGKPSATDIAKRTVAAFETNPDAYLVLRAKALQDKSMNDDVDKKLKAKMEKNRREGKEIFTIGNFQLTTDDAKKAYGNVKHYLKGFYDIISDAETPAELEERQKVQAQASKTTEALKKTTEDIKETKPLIIKETKPSIIKETKTPDKVSSVEPELSTAQKVATAINTVVGSGTATVDAKTFEELPEEIKALPKKFQYITDEDAAKSIKRNNPFNVEKGDNWQGLVKSDSNRFFATDTPLNGLRAGYINILAKLKKGKTLGETIQILSPKSDKNPTPAMITLAATMSEVNKNDKLEVSMNNFEKIKQLGLALLEFEAPNHNYPDSLINEAVKLAIEQKTRKTKKPILPKTKQIPDIEAKFAERRKRWQEEINVGANSIPKVQGEVIEEVAQKAIKNPDDGLWDFKKNTIRPIKDMARSALNTVPMHLRFVVDYVKDNKLLGGGEQEVVTERHMTPEVVKVLKTAIHNAKKRGLVKDAKGFWRVEYKDYPMTKSGVSVQSLFQAGTLTKKQADAGRERWGSSFGGVMRMIGDAFDPVVAGSGTFGAFGFKEVNGEIIIEDVYDFSKFKGEATTAYSAIRKWISTEQGDKTYKTTARLGKIKKDDLWS